MAPRVPNDSVQWCWKGDSIQRLIGSTGNPRASIEAYMSALEIKPDVIATEVKSAAAKRVAFLLL
jgi:hypothetical protein